MFSFLEVWNHIQEQEQPDDKQLQAMKVIRKGLSFAKPGCKDFWESFKEICNDAPGLHALLGVDPTMISQWAQTIELYLSKIRMEDSGAVKEKRAEILPTGNNGPLTATARDVRGTTEEPRPF
jgi:hypothetical protein